MKPSTTEDLSPVVGRPPSIAGAAGRAVAQRVEDSAVARHAAKVPAVVRRGIDSPVVRDAVTSGVEAVRRTPEAGVAVAQDLVRSAPRQAARVAGTSVAVARAARTAGQAVSDRVFAGVPDVDDIARMGANAMANWAAQVTSGQVLNGSAWKRFGKYRTRFEP